MKLFHINDPHGPSRTGKPLNFNFNDGYEMSLFMISIARICESSKQEGHIIWNSGAYTVSLWFSDPKMESIILLQAKVATYVES